MLPSIFVSHGAPTMILTESPVRTFLRELGATLGRPDAVLCVSAHWERRSAEVCSVANPQTIHDFTGFPDALYQMNYGAPGAPDVARRAAELLNAAGMAAEETEKWGLDHGAWVPMMLMYPDAQIPIAQLSVQHNLGPDHHLEMGRALAALRGENVLILASGGAVHNLKFFHKNGQDVEDWAQDFDDWLAGRVEAGDWQALAEYRTRHPGGETAHPRDEHYLPLLVAAGAAGETGSGRVLHRGFMDGSLSMAAFAFD